MHFYCILINKFCKHFESRVHFYAPSPTVCIYVCLYLITVVAANNVSTIHIFKSAVINVKCYKNKMLHKLTRSLICEFSKASRTPDDLNLGPKTITVGRLRVARCVDSWSTALSRFALDSSPKIVTIGPLLRKSLGSTHDVDGQLKYSAKLNFKEEVSTF